MSRVSQFLYSNTTAGENTLIPTDLKLTKNYSLSQDQANVVVLNNKTAPIDAEEIVSIRSRDVDGVKTNANIQFPAPVKKGIEYSIRTDSVLSTTDSDDASYRVDDAIVVTTSVRHLKSGNISPAHVQACIMRNLSSWIKEDGTWRIADLMRSAERPIED